MKVQELFEVKSKESAFQGGRKTATITKAHKPLIWESMLGTVNARKYDDLYSKLAPKYFDYDYDAARAYAGVSKCDDLRLCKNKERYQNYPSVGQLVLWGIPQDAAAHDEAHKAEVKRENDEYTARVEKMRAKRNASD